MSTSTPASINARARLYWSSSTPTAAATRRRPAESLVACGNCSLLAKSLTVIRPWSRPASSTSGSFSTLCWRSRASAPSLLTPTGAVTRGILVMMSRTSAPLSVTKRVSRLVTMPSSAPPLPTTGAPEIRYRAHSASTSRSVSSGEQVIGLVTIPASERLTRSTWAACSSIGRLRCSTPMPPWRAMAIAIRASVTVSMALDTSGTASSTLRVSRLWVVDPLGVTSDSSGSRRTSSKVRPSGSGAMARSSWAGTWAGPARRRPFAGDPADPSNELSDLEVESETGGDPLTPAEREDVLEDLADLEIYQALLTPVGVRGLVIECEDCHEPHYFDWDLLRGNLRHLLDSGRPRVHEPAYDPDPDHYVTWEYARGYADGVHDTLTENGE